MNGAERLERSFRDTEGSALVTYLCAGDPTPTETLDLMIACADGGADVIELGVPFSDPTADGPTIQAASERALAAGTRVEDVLGACREFVNARPHCPVVLFGYWNPWHRIGPERTARLVEEAGASGLLVVDLPPEESATLDAECERRGLARVFLVAPNTGAERMSMVARRGSGFIYLVAMKGVTGQRLSELDHVREQTRAVRDAYERPVAVGFGIADPAAARAVGTFADGVVVGSALVRAIASQDTPKGRQDAARSFTAALKRSLDP